MSKGKVKLTEAPKRITIDVTEQDIRLGKKEDIEACAIARAVKRTMGDNPEVIHGEFEVTIGDDVYFYDIPKKATTFIEKFDNDKKSVKPISFVATLQKHPY